MNELVKASPAATAMAVAVIDREPEENTERLLSALRSTGCSVVIKRRLTFPSSPSTGEPSGWREVVNGADLALTEGADPVNALALVDKALAPASPPNIGVWLTELAHITAKRNEDADSAMLTMTAYIKRLVQYPGDIVRQTLQEWSGKWFPTWGELKEILDARSAGRLAVRDALNGMIPKNAHKLPSAYEKMDPEMKAQWLRKEAEWARRSDPERAAELSQQAENLEAEIRDQAMGT
jgi:hypothetical protein